MDGSITNASGNSGLVREDAQGQENPAILRHPREDLLAKGGDGGKPRKSEITVACRPMGHRARSDRRGRRGRKKRSGNKVLAANAEKINERGGDSTRGGLKTVPNEGKDKRARCNGLLDGGCLGVKEWSLRGEHAVLLGGRRGIVEDRGERLST